MEDGGKIISRKQPEFHLSSLAKSFMGLMVLNELEEVCLRAKSACHI